jgi:hypothetical protein
MIIDKLLSFIMIYGVYLATCRPEIITNLIWNM